LGGVPRRGARPTDDAQKIGKYHAAAGETRSLQSSLFI
jgi:hypothetical protein